MRPLSDSRKASLEAAVSRYEATGALADEWLKARGIGPEWRVAFRLGVVADPTPGHENVRGRLSIPSLGHDDRPLSIRFRDISGADTKFKYIGETGQETRPFNIRALHRAADAICITEGELDAISLEICGYHAVGITGVTNWKPHHPRLFAGFRRVWLFGDGDEKGREFNSRLEREMDNAVPVHLPDGADANSLLVEYGSDFLRALCQ